MLVFEITIQNRYKLNKRYLKLREAAERDPDNKDLQAELVNAKARIYNDLLYFTSTTLSCFFYFFIINRSQSPEYIRLWSELVNAKPSINNDLLYFTRTTLSCFFYFFLINNYMFFTAITSRLCIKDVCSLAIEDNTLLEVTPRPRADLQTIDWVASFHISFLLCAI